METKDRKMVRPSENGQKPASTTTKATESKSEATESKPEAKTEQRPAIKMLTMARASDRLGKFEQFQKLGERFEFLKEKDKELKSFTISQDGTVAKISLECQGAKVMISNSAIIEKVVEVCQKELDVLLDKTEKEVLEFVI
jgi:hypothetical protein